MPNSGKTKVHLALFFGSDRDTLVRGGEKYMKQVTVKSTPSASQQ